jgi:hypothetical protein
VTKELATEVMTPNEWKQWLHTNERVRYVGVETGPAVLEVLRNYALEVLFVHHVTEERPVDVSLNLDEIIGRLRAGGFEFRSGAPLREVNAALMKLQGVEKLKAGTYRLADISAVDAEASEAAYKELRP